MNIPIYRAKKKNNDEYIQGYLLSKNIIVTTEYHYPQGMPSETEKKFNNIDISTIAIHFPDMLDSQGNKIFASLSEDGKGGDIVKYEQVLGGILKLSGPKECIVKYCNRDHVIAPFFINAKYKNQKTYMTKEHLQVIGIQK